MNTEYMLIVFYIAILILVLAGYWKTFEKAGHQGWACIIPIYNMYILCLIAEKPGWWVLLMLIPIVNIIVILIVNMEVARAFGQGTGFGIGLTFLSFIFYPMLGFGDYTYQASALDVTDHLIE